MSAPNAGLSGAGAEREYLAVLRKLGSLQHLLSQIMRQHHQQVVALERRLMRQSARLLLEVTRNDWGLARVCTARSQRRVVWQAQALICRTGCAMDAYHWRDGDQCRLLGGACLAPFFSSSVLPHGAAPAARAGDGGCVSTISE